MRTGAERPAGVDDDGELLRRRRDPGRPDPQPSRVRRVVELLPAVLPAVGNRFRRRLREGVAYRGYAGRVDVDGELGRLAVDALLESRRSVRDEPSSRDLGGLGRRDGEGYADEPAQRSALLSRLKKPPSSSRGR